MRLKEKMIQDSKHENVVFCGGFSWVHLYGDNIDRAYPKSLYNVAELDEPDEITMNDFYREYDAKNWTVMIAHIIGVDHAGHYFSDVAHSEIERKLGDAEILIKKLMDKLDDDTVMLVFGDHGMTDMGGHGGESQEELRTALFGYSKGGFPMKSKSDKILSIFDEMTKDLKQLDLPSMLASLLHTLLPFQNVGVLHPYLSMTSDMATLEKRMMLNIEQLQVFLTTYCSESGDRWCKEKLKEIKEFKENASHSKDA
jgi:GPI ethanolamine phosphate transferase 3 subunit O